MVARRDVAVWPRSGRPYTSLRGRSAFQRVYRQGTRRKAAGVTVVAAPGSPGLPRVGVVAARGMGRAVDRNRAKRRLRSALARVGLRDGTDYIVIAGPAVNEVAFDRLVTELERVIWEKK